MSSPDLTTQLVELQSQVAFQEDALQRLDDAVTAQQRRLDDLERLLESVTSRLADVAAAVDDQTADAPPPHY